MKTYLLLISFIMLIIASACDEEGPNCKAENHVNKTVSVTAPVNAPIPGGEFTTSLFNGTRTYQWANTISFVCIYDIVSVSVSIAAFDDYDPSHFSTRTEILYGNPINTQAIDLVLSSPKLLQGSNGANLLPAFVVGTGSFTTLVEISFPSSGNADQDMVSLLGKIRSITIILKYSKG